MLTSDLAATRCCSTTAGGVRTVSGRKSGRRVVRGEVAVQDDGCRAQRRRVNAAGGEPDRGRVHGTDERRLGEPLVDDLSILLAELGEAGAGEGDAVKIERGDQVDDRGGEVTGGDLEHVERLG